MQISYLNRISNSSANIRNIDTQNVNVQNQDLPVQTQSSQKVFAKHMGFQALNFKSHEQPSLEHLINDYKWFVNADNTKPLEAFLKIKTDKRSINKLFEAILKDDNMSYDLINDIAGRARDYQKNYKFLRELLGEDSQNLQFFHPNNAYCKAFSKFMDRRYNEAKSVENLLKLRPDWKEEALVNKFEQIRGHRNLEIGNMPSDFWDGRFEKICTYLKQFSQNGYKCPKEIPPITIDNRRYEFEYFTQGKTDKNVFGVYTPEKKYVFKIADESRKSLNEPYSLGALALIDTYLTLNNCRNIAPIYYYNHNSNTSIYKYQEHNMVNHKLSSSYEVNNYMPDFKALGMCYNDTIGSENYYLSDVDCNDNEYNFNYGSGNKLKKELISVDNDHVTFTSPFMLMNSPYVAPLPNAMQNSF